LSPNMMMRCPFADGIRVLSGLSPSASFQTPKTT
jgi:hypothetical protein